MVVRTPPLKTRVLRTDSRSSSSLSSTRGHDASIRGHDTSTRRGHDSHVRLNRGHDVAHGISLVVPADGAHAPVSSASLHWHFF